MITNTKPLFVILLLVLQLCGINFANAQSTEDCYLDAGEDIETEEDNLISLDATAVNVSNYKWGTFGDGFFLNENQLHTFYVPGDADLDNREVTLYIEHGRPDFPNDDFVDFYTIKSGEWDDPEIWDRGYAPPQNINDMTIVLRHNVVVKQGIIKIDNGGRLFADNVKFTMFPNRSFIILNGEAVFYNGEFKQLENQFGNGSAQADLLLSKESSKLTMIGTDVHISGNFHNNGTRILENVSLKVDKHYHNNGTDMLINVCAEVAYEQKRFGHGPGNIINSASADLMYVENTNMYTYNGNMVNNSVISGNFSALRIEEGGLVNNGDWNASVNQLCVDHNVNGSYDTALPNMDCAATDAAIANCIFDPCIAGYDELNVYFIFDEDSNDVIIHDPGEIDDDDEDNGGGVDNGDNGGDNPDDDGGADDGDDDGSDGPVKGGGNGGGPIGPGISVRNGPDALGSDRLDIYPNPVFSHSSFRIATDLSGTRRIRITASNGSVVFDGNHELDESFMLGSLSSLEAGIYFVEVIDGMDRSYARIAVLD